MANLPPSDPRQTNRDNSTLLKNREQGERRVVHQKASEASADAARQRTEASLLDSEQRLRMLAEHLPAGTVYREGESIFFNRATEEITGYRRSELKTIDAWFAALYGEDADAVRCLYERDREADFPSTRTVPLVRKNGQTRIVEFAGYVCALGEVWVLHDVTQRHRSEAALRASEEGHRLLVEHAPYCIHQLECDGRLISMNPAGLAMLGAEHEDQVTGKDYLVLVQEEDRHRINERLQRATNGESSEFDFRAANGLIIQSSFVPIFDGDGVVTRVMGISQDITQRRQAEDAVRESESKFRAIFNGAAIGIAHGDPQGKSLESNFALQNMLGYTADELRQMVFTEFTHPDDAQAEMPIYRELIAGQRDHYEMDKRYIAKDGRLVWGHLTVYLVRAENGTPSFAIGMIEDIGKRKHAEEALRDSEQRFRSIADAAPVMIWQSDLEKRGIYFNQPWLDFTGRPLEDELGHGWTKGIHPDDRDRCLSVCAAAMDRRQEFQMEYRLRAADDKYRWVLDRGVPHYWPGGEFVGYIGSCIDITERKLAEETIRDSESKFRALFEGAAIGITRVNLQGRLLESNPALQRMLGYTADELQKMVFKDFTHPEDAAIDMALYMEMVEGKRSHYERDKRYLRKDGQIVWGHLTVSMVRGDSGQPLFGIGMVENITERKRAEERLMQAERLSAIGEAMTGLAHESRNALQRSQACLTILSNRIQDSPQLNELLVEIQQAQDDLHQLYEGVRRYAAPGKLKLKWCNLRDLLQETWEHLAPARADRQARLQEIDRAGDLYCDVDPLAIREVFRNILENALAAAEAVSEIDVEYARAQLHGKPAIRISIANNGPGLDAEQQMRIFDAFYTTSSHGTGLGMAIAKRLVEEHHGEIAVGAGAEQKARLVVTLPTRQT